MKNSPSLSSCILPCFVLYGTEFWVGFSSAEWFGTKFREFASIFVLRNGIASYFLFRVRFLNEIPRICCYFCSTERNPSFFSSAKGLGTEFREILFRGTAGIPSEITICSANSVFRGIIFLSEIPNPSGGEVWRRYSAHALPFLQQAFGQIFKDDVNDFSSTSGIFFTV